MNWTLLIMLFLTKLIPSGCFKFSVFQQMITYSLGELKSLSHSKQELRAKPVSATLMTILYSSALLQREWAPFSKVRLVVFPYKLPHTHSCSLLMCRLLGRREPSLFVPTAWHSSRYYAHNNIMLTVIPKDSYGYYLHSTDREIESQGWSNGSEMSSGCLHLSLSLFLTGMLETQFPILSKSGGLVTARRE